MKISISNDDWYPVHSVEDPPSNPGFAFEVDAETVARWKKAEADFEAVQEERKTARDEAWKKSKAR